VLQVMAMQQQAMLQQQQQQQMGMSPMQTQHQGGGYNNNNNRGPMGGGGGRKLMQGHGGPRDVEELLQSQNQQWIKVGYATALPSHIPPFTWA
jgi:hypothetical protein